MLGRLLFSLSIIAAIALFVLVNVVSPTAAGPLGLLAVFLLLYIAVLGLVTFILYGVSALLRRFSKLVITRRPWRRLTLLEAYYYSSVVSIAPVIFLGMQSVAAIGIYDVLLVSVLVGLGCFYIAKRIK